MRASPSSRASITNPGASRWCTAPKSRTAAQTSSGWASIAISLWMEAMNVVLVKPSFRGDAKHRTRNLEIPRCAIAHLRSGANAPSWNDGRLRTNRLDIVAIGVDQERREIGRAVIDPRAGPAIVAASGL